MSSSKSLELPKIDVDDEEFEDFEEADTTEDLDSDISSDVEDLDKVLDANGRYTISVSTSFGDVKLEQYASDGCDPTWHDLLKTFYLVLKVLGYSFSKANKKRFKKLFKSF